MLQVPKEYIPGVTKGLEEMMSSGALAGFPVVDVVATLYDGSYHDVDSSVLAFQIAARQAFRYGMSQHVGSISSKPYTLNPKTYWVLFNRVCLRYSAAGHPRPSAS